MGSGLINFSIILSLFLGVLALIGALPGVELIALLPVLAVTVWFAISLGVTLGILNVFSGCRAFFQWFTVLVLAYTDCLSRIDPSGLGASASGF